MTDRAPRRPVTWWRLITLAAIVIVLAVVVHRAGGGDLLHREGLGRLRQWVETLGVLGPPAFIGCYVLTAVAFVPALPMSVLGGLLFGPLWGTVYASIGSTLGALETLTEPGAIVEPGWMWRRHPFD